jgi:hypothetical protein
MRDSILYGVGHLKKAPSNDDDDSGPVYISEPLIVFSLSSIFEEHPHTQRDVWIKRSICNAPNASGLGYVLEELILQMLVDKFGGNGARLDSVFCFRKSSELGSRSVRLVSLMKDTRGEMYSCPVSWIEGASDRLGFKARDPDDDIKFLCDPQGKTFLFPCVHMGPDGVCFGVDEDGNIIVFLIQSKKTLKFPAATRIRAWDSVNPDNFYTETTVCLKHSILIILVMDLYL